MRETTLAGELERRWGELGLFYCAVERGVAENRAGESLHVYELRGPLLYSNVSQPGFHITSLEFALEIVE